MTFQTQKTPITGTIIDGQQHIDFEKSLINGANLFNILQYSQTHGMPVSKPRPKEEFINEFGQYENVDPLYNEVTNAYDKYIEVKNQSVPKGFEFPDTDWIRKMGVPDYLIKKDPDKSPVPLGITHMYTWNNRSLQYRTEAGYADAVPIGKDKNDNWVPMETIEDYGNYLQWEVGDPKKGEPYVYWREIRDDEFVDGQRMKTIFGSEQLEGSFFGGVVRGFWAGTAPLMAKGVGSLVGTIGDLVTWETDGYEPTKGIERELVNWGNYHTHKNANERLSPFENWGSFNWGLWNGVGQLTGIIGTGYAMGLPLHALKVAHASNIAMWGSLALGAWEAGGMVKEEMRKMGISELDAAKWSSVFATTTLISEMVLSPNVAQAFGGQMARRTLVLNTGKGISEAMEPIKKFLKHSGKKWDEVPESVKTNLIKKAYIKYRNFGQKYRNKAMKDWRWRTGIGAFEEGTEEMIEGFMHGGLAPMVNQMAMTQASAIKEQYKDVKFNPIISLAEQSREGILMPPDTDQAAYQMIDENTGQVIKEITIQEYRAIQDDINAANKVLNGEALIDEGMLNWDEGVMAFLSTGLTFGLGGVFNLNKKKREQNTFANLAAAEMQDPKKEKYHNQGIAEYTKTLSSEIDAKGTPIKKGEKKETYAQFMGRRIREQIDYFKTLMQKYGINSPEVLQAVNSNNALVVEAAIIADRIEKYNAAINAINAGEQVQEDSELNITSQTNADELKAYRQREEEKLQTYLKKKDFTYEVNGKTYEAQRSPAFTKMFLRTAFGDALITSIARKRARSVINAKPGDLDYDDKLIEATRQEKQKIISNPADYASIMEGINWKANKIEDQFTGQQIAIWLNDFDDKQGTLLNAFKESIRGEIAKENKDITDRKEITAADLEAGLRDVFGDLIGMVGGITEITDQAQLNDLTNQIGMTSEKLNEFLGGVRTTDYTNEQVEAVISDIISGLQNDINRFDVVGATDTAIEKLGEATSRLPGQPVTEENVSDEIKVRALRNIIDLGTPRSAEYQAASRFSVKELLDKYKPVLEDQNVDVPDAQTAANDVFLAQGFLDEIYNFIAANVDLFQNDFEKHEEYAEHSPLIKDPLGKVPVSRSEELLDQIKEYKSELERIGNKLSEMTGSTEVYFFKTKAVNLATQLTMLEHVTTSFPEHFPKELSEAFTETLDKISELLKNGIEITGAENMTFENIEEVYTAFSEDIEGKIRPQLQSLSEQIEKELIAYIDKLGGKLRSFLTHFIKTRKPNQVYEFMEEFSYNRSNLYNPMDKGFATDSHSPARYKDGIAKTDRDFHYYIWYTTTMLNFYDSMGKEGAPKYSQLYKQYRALLEDRNQTFEDKNWNGYTVPSYEQEQTILMATSFLFNPQNDFILDFEHDTFEHNDFINYSMFIRGFAGTGKTTVVPSHVFELYRKIKGGPVKILFITPNANTVELNKTELFEAGISDNINVLYKQFHEVQSEDISDEIDFVFLDEATIPPNEMTHSEDNKKGLIKILDDTNKPKLLTGDEGQTVQIITNEAEPVIRSLEGYGLQTAGIRTLPLTRVYRTRIQMFATLQQHARLAFYNRSGFENIKLKWKYSKEDGRKLGGQYFENKEEIIHEFLSYIDKNETTVTSDDAILIVLTPEEKQRVIDKYLKGKKKDIHDLIKVYHYDYYRYEQTGDDSHLQDIISGISSQNVFVAMDFRNEKYRGADVFRESHKQSRALLTTSSRAKRYLALIGNPSYSPQVETEAEDSAILGVDMEQDIDASFIEYEYQIGEKKDGRLYRILDKQKVKDPVKQKEASDVTAPLSERGAEDVANKTTNIRKQWKTPGRNYTHVTDLVWQRNRDKKREITDDVVFERARRYVFRKALEYYSKIAEGRSRELALDEFTEDIKAISIENENYNFFELYEQHHGEIRKTPKDLAGAILNSVKMNYNLSVMMGNELAVSSPFLKDNANKVVGSPAFVNVVGYTTRKVTQKNGKTVNKTVPIVDIIDVNIVGGETSGISDISKQKLGAYMALLAKQGAVINRVRLLNMNLKIAERDTEEFTPYELSENEKTEAISDAVENILKTGDDAQALSETTIPTEEDFQQNERIDNSVLEEIKVNQYYQNQQGDNVRVTHKTIHKGVPYVNIIDRYGATDRFTAEQFSKFNISKYQRRGDYFKETAEIFNTVGSIYSTSAAFFTPSSFTLKVPKNYDDFWNINKNELLRARQIVWDNVKVSSTLKKQRVEPGKELRMIDVKESFDVTAIETQSPYGMMINVMTDEQATEMIERSDDLQKLLPGGTVSEKLDVFKKNGLHIVSVDSEVEIDYGKNGHKLHEVDELQLLARNYFKETNETKSEEILDQIFENSFKGEYSNIQKKDDDPHRSSLIALNKERMRIRKRHMDKTYNPDYFVERKTSGALLQFGEYEFLSFDQVITNLENNGLEIDRNSDRSIRITKLSASEQADQRAKLVINVRRPNSNWINVYFYGKKAALSDVDRMISELDEATDDIEKKIEDFEKEMPSLSEKKRTERFAVQWQYLDTFEAVQFLRHNRWLIDRQLRENNQVFDPYIYIEQDSKYMETKIRGASLKQKISNLKRVMSNIREAYVNDEVPEDGMYLTPFMEDPGAKSTNRSNSKDDAELKFILTENLAPSIENISQGHVYTQLVKVSKDKEEIEKPPEEDDTFIPFRVGRPNELDYNTERIENLETELRRILGSTAEDRVIFTDKPILSNNAETVYGQVRDAMMVFYEKDGSVLRNVGRHEAVHFIMLHLVKPEVANALLRQAKVELIARGHFNPTDSDAHEYIANLFEDGSYQRKKKNIITQFIDWVFRVINRLSGITYSLYDFLDSVEAGDFRNSGIITSTPTEILNKSIKNKYTNANTVEDLVNRFDNYQNFYFVRDHYVVKRLLAYSPFGNEMSISSDDMRRQIQRTIDYYKSHANDWLKKDEKLTIIYNDDITGKPRPIEKKVEELTPGDFDKASQNITGEHESTNVKAFDTYVKYVLGEPENVLIMLQNAFPDINFDEQYSQMLSGKIRGKKAYWKASDEQSAFDSRNTFMKALLSMIPYYHLDGNQARKQFLDQGTLHRVLITSMQNLKSRSVEQNYENWMKELHDLLGSLGRGHVASTIYSFLLTYGDLVIGESYTMSSGITVGKKWTSNQRGRYQSSEKLLFGVGMNAFVNGQDYNGTSIRDYYTLPNSKGEVKIEPHVWDYKANNFKNILRSIFNFYYSLTTRVDTQVRFEVNRYGDPVKTEMINRGGYETNLKSDEIKKNIQSTLFEEGDHYRSNVVNKFHGINAYVNFSSGDMTMGQFIVISKEMEGRKTIFKYKQPDNEAIYELIDILGLRNSGLNHSIVQKIMMDPNEKGVFLRNLYYMTLSVKAGVYLQKDFNEAMNKHEVEDGEENREVVIPVNLSANTYKYFEELNQYYQKTDFIEPYNIDHFRGVRVYREQFFNSLPNPNDFWHYFKNNLSKHIIMEKSLVGDRIIFDVHNNPVYQHPVSNFLNDKFPASSGFTFERGKNVSASTETSSVWANQLKERAKNGESINTPIYSSKEGRWNNALMNEKVAFDGFRYFGGVPSTNYGVKFRNMTPKDLITVLIDSFTIQNIIDNRTYASLISLLDPISDKPNQPLVQYYPKKNGRRTNFFSVVKTKGNSITQLAINKEVFTYLMDDIVFYYEEAQKQAEAKWKKISRMGVEKAEASNYQKGRNYLVVKRNGKPTLEKPRILTDNRSPLSKINISAYKKADAEGKYKILRKAFLTDFKNFVNYTWENGYRVHNKYNSQLGWMKIRDVNDVVYSKAVIEQAKKEYINRTVVFTNDEIRKYIKSHFGGKSAKPFLNKLSPIIKQELKDDTKKKVSEKEVINFLESALKDDEKLDVISGKVKDLILKEERGKIQNDDMIGFVDELVMDNEFIAENLNTPIAKFARRVRKEGDVFEFENGEQAYIDEEEWHPLMEVAFWSHHIINEPISQLIRGSSFEYRDIIDFVKRATGMSAPGEVFGSKNTWSLIGGSSRVLHLEDIKVDDTESLFKKQIEGTDGLSVLNPIFHRMLEISAGDILGNISQGALKTVNYHNDPLTGVRIYFKMAQMPVGFTDFRNNSFLQSMARMMIGERILNTRFNNGSITEDTAVKTFDEKLKNLQSASQYREIINEIVDMISMPENQDLRNGMVDYTVFNTAYKAGQHKKLKIPGNKPKKSFTDLQIPMEFNSDENVIIASNENYRLQNITYQDILDTDKTLPTQILYMMYNGIHNADLNRVVEEALYRFSTTGVNRLSDVNAESEKGRRAFIKNLGHNNLDRQVHGEKFAETLLQHNILPDVQRRRNVTNVIRYMNDYVKPVMYGQQYVQMPSTMNLYFNDEGQPFMAQDLGLENDAHEDKNMNYKRRQLNPIRYRTKDGREIRNKSEIDQNSVFVPAEVLIPFYYMNNFGIGENDTLVRAMTISDGGNTSYLYGKSREEISKFINDLSINMAIDLSLTAKQIEVFEWNEETTEQEKKNDLIDYYYSFNKALDLFAVRIPTTNSSSGFKARVVGFVNDTANTIYTSAKKNIIDGSDYDIDALSVYFRALNGYRYIEPNLNDETFEDSINNSNLIIEQIFEYYNRPENSEMILQEIDVDSLRKAADDREIVGTDVASDVGSALKHVNINQSGARLVGHFVTMQNLILRLSDIDLRYPQFLKDYNLKVNSKLQNPHYQLNQAINLTSKFVNLATDNPQEGGVLGRLNINETVTPLISGMIYSGKTEKEIIDTLINNEEIIVASNKTINDKSVTERTSTFLDNLTNPQLKSYALIGQALMRLRPIISIQQEFQTNTFAIYSLIYNVEQAIGAPLQTFIDKFDEAVTDEKNTGKFKAVTIPIESQVNFVHNNIDKHRSNAWKSNDKKIREYINIAGIVSTQKNLMGYLKALNEIRSFLENNFQIYKNKQVWQAAYDSLQQPVFFYQNQFEAFEQGMENWMIGNFISENYIRLGTERMFNIFNKKKGQMINMVEKIRARIDSQNENMGFPRQIQKLRENIDWKTTDDLSIKNIRMPRKANYWEIRDAYDLSDPKQRMYFVLAFPEFVKEMKNNDDWGLTNNLFIKNLGIHSRYDNHQYVEFTNSVALDFNSKSDYQSAFNRLPASIKAAFRIYHTLVFGFSYRNGSFGDVIDTAVEKQFSDWVRIKKNPFKYEAELDEIVYKINPSDIAREIIVRQKGVAPFGYWDQRKKATSGNSQYIRSNFDLKGRYQIFNREGIPLSNPMPYFINGYFPEGNTFEYKVLRGLSLDQLISVDIMNATEVTSGRFMGVTYNPNIDGLTHIIHNNSKALLENGLLVDVQKINYSTIRLKSHTPSIGTETPETSPVEVRSKNLSKKDLNNLLDTSEFDGNVKSSRINAKSMAVGREHVEFLVDRMQKVFPNLNVRLYDNTDWPVEYGDDIANVHNGTININSDRIQYDTPVHELSHVFFDVIAMTNPSLYNTLYNAAQRLYRGGDSELSRLIDIHYPNKTEAEKILELMATMVGWSSAAKVERFLNNVKYRNSGNYAGIIWNSIKDLVDRVKRFINNLMKSVFGVTFGKSVDELTIQEFGNTIANALIKGEAIHYIDSGKYRQVFGDNYWSSVRLNKVNNTKKLFDELVTPSYIPNLWLENYIAEYAMDNNNEFDFGGKKWIFSEYQGSDYKSKIQDIIGEMNKYNESLEQRMVDLFNSNNWGVGNLINIFGTHRTVKDKPFFSEQHVFKSLRKLIRHTGYDKYIKYSDLIKEPEYKHLYNEAFEGFDFIIALHPTDDSEIVMSIYDITMDKLSWDKTNKDNILKRFNISNRNAKLNRITTSNNPVEIRKLMVHLVGQYMMQQDPKVKVFDNAVIEVGNEGVRYSMVDPGRFMLTTKGMAMYDDFLDVLDPSVKKVFESQQIESNPDYMSLLISLYNNKDTDVKWKNNMNRIINRENISVSDKIEILSFRLKSILAKRDETSNFSPGEIHEIRLIINSIMQLQNVPFVEGTINPVTDMSNVEKYLDANSIGNEYAQKIRSAVLDASNDIVHQAMEFKKEFHADNGPIAKALKLKRITYVKQLGRDVMSNAFEPLFHKTKDANGNTIYTGLIYWTNEVTADMTETEKTLAQDAKKNNISPELLEIGKWIVDKVDEYLARNLYAARMNDIGSSNKFINWETTNKRKYTLEDARKNLKRELVYHRGMIPIMSRTGTEHLSRGKFGKAVTQKFVELTDVYELFDEISPGQAQSYDEFNKLSDIFFYQFGYNHGYSSITKIGSQNRVANHLGLKINENRQYVIDDNNPNVNANISTDLQRIMDYFVLGTLRKENYESNVLPFVNGMKVYLHDLKNFGTDLSGVIDYTNIFTEMGIRGKRHKLTGSIASVRLDNALEVLRTMAGPLVMGFNINIGAISLITNTMYAFMEGIASEVADKGVFNAKDLLKATKEVMGNYHLVSQLAKDYQVINMDEYNLVNHRIRQKGRKYLWDQHITNWTNWASDYFARSVIMVAQMLHDGSYQAHTYNNETGEVEYDSTKDKRFETEEGKALYKFLKEKYISENKFGQTEDKPLVRAYDFSEGRKFKMLADKYVVGSYGNMERSALAHTTLGRMFVMFSNWLIARATNAFNTSQWSKEGGKYVMVKTENGEYIPKWERMFIEGYVTTSMRLGYRKIMGMMGRAEALKWESLSQGEKHNIAKFLSNIAMTAIMYLLYNGFVDEDDDGKKPIPDWRLIRNFKYAYQSLLVLPNLIEMIRNPLPALDIIGSFFYDPLGRFSMGKIPFETQIKTVKEPVDELLNM